MGPRIYIASSILFLYGYTDYSDIYLHISHFKHTCDWLVKLELHSAKISGLELTDGAKQIEI